MNIIKITIAFLLISYTSSSQVKDSTELVDITDIFNKLRGKPQILDSVLTPIGKPIWGILPGFGYSILKGPMVLFDANVSFYTYPKTNLSIIQFIPEYTFKKFFTPTLVGNIWAKDNLYNFTFDYRYYHYTILDFGIGSFSKESVFNNYKLDYVRLKQNLSKAIGKDLFIGFSYNYEHYYGIKNIQESVVTNATEFGLKSSSVTSGIGINLLFDNRRNGNTPNPKSWYANLVFTQNLKSLKSTSNYNVIYSEIRHYVPFPKNTKGILAFQNINWFTFSKNVPYLDLPSSGTDTYNNMARTFVQSRFRGQKLIYNETEYRFNLTRNGLFGASFFFNIQAYSDPNTYHFSKLIPGYGTSFRFKLNKKSKLNFVTSYGYGYDGARGFMFNLGEVF